MTDKMPLVDHIAALVAEILEWCNIANAHLDSVRALEAELAKRTQERDGVAANLANTQIMFEDWKVVHSTVALEVALVRERERRDAAEVALRMIRIDAAWAIDAKQQVLDHFARHKD